jgi:hypothetical protein
MGIEIIIGILAASISALIGGFIPLIEKIYGKGAQAYYEKNPNSIIGRFLYNIFNLRKKSSDNFKEKIDSSLILLKKSTSEIDSVINEVTELSKEKQKAIELLENQLKELSDKETHLKQKIETLEQTPIDSIQYFEEVLKRNNKRDKKRDYILFALGVLITTIVGIIINLII